MCTRTRGASAAETYDGRETAPRGGDAAAFPRSAGRAPFVRRGATAGARSAPRACSARSSWPTATTVACLGRAVLARHRAGGAGLRRSRPGCIPLIAGARRRLCTQPAAGVVPQARTARRSPWASCCQSRARRHAAGGCRRRRGRLLPGRDRARRYRRRGALAPGQSRAGWHRRTWRPTRRKRTPVCGGYRGAAGCAAWAALLRHDHLLHGAWHPAAPRSRGAGRRPRSTPCTSSRRPIGSRSRTATATWPISDFVPVPVAGLLDPGYLASARRAHRRRALDGHSRGRPPARLLQGGRASGRRARGGRRPATSPSSTAGATRCR